MSARTRSGRFLARPDPLRGTRMPARTALNPVAGFTTVRMTALLSAETDRRLTLLTSRPITRVRLLGAEIAVTAAAGAVLVTGAGLLTWTGVTVMGAASSHGRPVLRARRAQNGSPTPTAYATSVGNRDEQPTGTCDGPAHRPRRDCAGSG